MIRDVASITYKNDEAYIGALAIVLDIQQALQELDRRGENDLRAAVVNFLPDTRVRDSLIELQRLAGKSVQEVGKLLGSSGYATQSVPWAIYAA